MDDLADGGHFVEDAADVEAKQLRLQQEQGTTVLFNSVSRFRCLISCIFYPVTWCYHSYFMLPWILCIAVVTLPRLCSNGLTILLPW